MKLTDFFRGLEEDYNISVYDFCYAKKLQLNSVKRYLEGRIPVLHVAKKIVRATGGKVTLKDLGLEQD